MKMIEYGNRVTITCRASDAFGVFKSAGGARGLALKRSIDGEAKSTAKIWLSTFIPAFSGNRFVLGFFKDDDLGAHPADRSRRFRTSSQGRPLAAPDFMRSMRRSISAAQADSTAASGSPSKLASSAEAISARSPTGSCLAVVSISSANLPMGQCYRRGRLLSRSRRRLAVWPR